VIRFFERPYPSANSILLTGHRPVLVDTGFGSDAPALFAWLEQQEVGAETLSLIVNTHSHCDHAGGNYALQSQFGTAVAASAGEAAPVNARDPDAGQARWLRQPIEAYHVGRILEPGDQVATGDSVWTVLATPGHTAGHLSLYCHEHGILVLGDAMHLADVGWLNPYREGADSLERSEDTIERLAALPAGSAYSGHGPAIRNLTAAFERARRRLRSWREEPERIAWHACKRIFAYALMLKGGLSEPGLAPYLLECPWFLDHARYAFRVSPADLAPRLLAEMLRADAAFWSGDMLLARAPYRPVASDWPKSPTDPAHWSQMAAPARRRRSWL
jgi:glyoxylase-like metal-dependent hydrolase (beta-lactamase superfamily II)